MVGTSSYHRWPLSALDGLACRQCQDRGRPGSCTVRNRSGITERDLTGLCGLGVVDRIVDRAHRTVGASCALCAFRRAFGAASAVRAGRRGIGKEKVYGSIP